jgi:hypothetical protein
MRSTVLATLVLGALGCGAARSAKHQAPTRLTRADSARITAAFLSGGAVVRHGTLQEYFARRDSVLAANAGPRRYKNLRVF